MRSTHHYILLICLLACTLTFPFGCRDREPEVIVSSTPVKYSEKYLSWSKRTALGYYQKYAKKGAWDNVAIQLMESVCQAGADNSVDTATLYAQAMKVKESGCDDPVVLNFCGRVLGNCSKGNEAKEMLSQSLANINSHYPASIAFSGARIMTDLLESESSPEVDKYRQIALQSLAKAIANGEYEPEEMNIVYRVIEDTWQTDERKYRNRWRNIQSIFSQQKNLDPWISKVIEAKSEIETGWGARFGSAIKP